MLWALHAIHTSCTVHSEISPFHPGLIGCDQHDPENCIWLDEIWKQFLKMDMQPGHIQTYLYRVVSIYILFQLDNPLIQFNFLLLHIQTNNLIWIIMMQNGQKKNLEHANMPWIEAKVILYCTCMSRKVASSEVNLDDKSPTCLYLSSYFFARMSTWN